MYKEELVRAIIKLIFVMIGAWWICASIIAITILRILSLVGAI